MNGLFRPEWSTLKKLMFLQRMGGETWSTITGNPVSFTAKAAPLKQLSVAFSPVQSGTGDPSPTNVRPISGWDSLTVEQRGVNVWDEEWEHGKFNLTTGAEVADDTRVRSKNYLPVKAGETYHIVTPNTLFLMLYDGAKNYMYEADSTANYTIPAGVAYLRIFCPSAYGATYNHDISINYPSSDTSYHAYNPASQTISITIGSTVYSGTVDVLTGVVMVTHFGVDLGTQNWTKWSVEYPYFYTVVSPAYKYLAAQTNFICSQYAHASIGSSGSTVGIYITDASNVRIRDLNYLDADAATFKTAMSGVQLVYELATPQTIQLTPQEVESLAGDNTLFSDANGDLTVEYRSN